ncbi:glycosyl transferase family 1 protein [Coccomyxa subellipsoidea C-169]|uniref:Glycosyl transferase family 1 protein n=1 Tax=Coccomyxa subellipsoidea (strain C-169) TaxID=574566 RepID=I0Z416_COCSC|nr:glycosyl transferase family 1 protein [Coccomyxa subellipsoidea C-169]EIE25385.1 glycosyl transferase family 1 protein [Coccomyxa subellipsoidea C-169]|eukprot:XP_005649929.1 glycosyl transferase family 1 protein [Coccomyxa subellipsoidea C-169]
MRKGRVWVVVLGDFGRSPRMQNHALSLAQQAGVQVHVIAYGGSKTNAAITKHQNIRVHTIPELRQLAQVLPRSVALIIKAAFQAFMLLFMMIFWLPSPDTLLLQVPPAIPTLVMCWLACVWHHATFMIDWHNFAHTLMALSMTHKHPLVALAKLYERFWGRFGHKHLCVSKAMQTELERSWHIKATVFYDRPPSHFRPTPLKEQHELLLRLGPVLDAPVHPRDCCGQSRPREEEHSLTVCTERLGGADGRVRLRADRPALIVSSTSWTPDEDFQILLDAAQQYDAQVRHSILCNAVRSICDMSVVRVQAVERPKALPRLLFLVTGKGPQRAAYTEGMRRLDLQRVAFRTAWLEAADYPLLLGSADLGVCLHTSSSGFDLPMKVVDMFGCGLPVCAADYRCINELVVDGTNGLLFDSASKLAAQLVELFEGFPHTENPLLKELQESVAGTGAVTWEDSWEKIVLPLFTQQH